MGIFVVTKFSRNFFKMNLAQTILNTVWNMVDIAEKNFLGKNLFLSVNRHEFLEL